ncbi:tRNA pseudouridine(13) synthase TruD [uncultured Methanobrevibacter sp.]|uniref:tRNA pseudouridine(13) synthase TruD n=1 Tax=uncultured Methanobrevibacter sp. TaxID=253161 RepID=UPI0025F0BEB6|nr:tRNA pseudouridine(13) synthase TruD [uncultured Methanobrevibacter sp.]
MLNANTYISKNPGIGGTIRNSYEDFYVEEIPEITPQGEGPNVWIWIEKLGRTTLDVLLDISRDLHISRKRMGFAGMKDKNALTRQWICISNMDSNEQLEEIINLEDKIKNTKFLKVVRGQKKLRLGQLIGNKFKIVIRDIPFNKDITSLEDAALRAKEILNQLEISGVPNYFGWQRFGKVRSTTHLVGEALIQNDLKKAVDTYIGHPTDGESQDSYNARVAYDEGNIKEALELMHGGMRYEKMMLRELISDLDKYGELNDKSYKNALHALPKPLSRMFVHAYQSYLFNEVVSRRVEMGINKYIEGDIIIDNEEKIIRDKTKEEYQQLIDKFQAHPTSPLYGTKVPFADGIVGEMEKDVLDKYGLTKEDFEVDKMPRLGSYGLRRSMRFRVWDSNVEIVQDGIRVEFSINKGAYATAVLREIMKVDVV